MNYLIAVDLEGVHGVVGEAYSALTKGAFDYANAVEAATLEVNTAASALFACGAEKVAVWDNHAGGGNLDFAKIDPRVTQIDAKNDEYRFDFVKEQNFAGILFIGYHAREGTPRAVLAHTYSSTQIQYVKLGGKPIGELGVDTYICQSHGIPPIFIASDSAGVAEMREIAPEITAVITKYGESRNCAVLKEREKVLREIYDGACKAAPVGISAFPKCAELEVRYTRAERAEAILAKAAALGIPAAYGEDTHILRFTIAKAAQIPKLL